ncbi:RNA polymerase subunit sigma-70 [Anaerobacillus alkalidiazotrophicus]|uniref:RNA polymerase sigma factor n=1 Tax=Anaerobacillus alkalidiazotrophicus TaxID=472963 RepID=A0A1S2M865_9BACI|nr:sigma-70 family RNA polymerase sigma factor [Anaerobacillus alkalidiazotrophicus]OIJ20776.1 RNA polymerase subunit sigma-70 [Anaerobacillus alkalidiazotrophicus]
MSNWRTLEDLYSLYYEEIFRYLLQRTRQKELAQDLAQDTFLKAFNGLASFKGNSSVRTWLYTIAHHTFINWYRRESKYHNHPIEKIFSLEQKTYKNPEEVVDQKAEQALLLAAIDSLKEDYQTVLILREYQQLSYDEIAEILGWKLSKVKTNLHRAKLELRMHFSRTEDDKYEV